MLFSHVFWQLGQTILISGSTDFFQNLKGRSVGRKTIFKIHKEFLFLQERNCNNIFVY